MKGNLIVLKTTLTSLLLISAFLVGGCNDKTKTAISLREELMQERPKLDEKKDYTDDLSGHWSWTAKRLNDKRIIGKGQFIILQKEKGSLVGINQIGEGMDYILPKDLQPDKVASLYLKGIRDNTSKERLQFTIRGNGLMVDNISTLSKKGHHLMGHGFSILNKQPTGQVSEKGQFSEIEYEWDAVRTTG